MFKKQVKFEIFFYLTMDILCPVLGNEKVDAYHVPSEKKAAEFYERLPQTLKNVLNFVLEKNHCLSKVFKDHERNFRAKDKSCYGRVRYSCSLSSQVG